MVFKPYVSAFNKSKAMMPYIVIGFLIMLTTLLIGLCFIWLYVRDHVKNEKSNFNNNTGYNLIERPLTMSEIETQNLLGLFYHQWIYEWIFFQYLILFFR